MSNEKLTYEKLEKAYHELLGFNSEKCLELKRAQQRVKAADAHVARLIKDSVSPFGIGTNVCLPDSDIMATVAEAIINRGGVWYTLVQWKGGERRQFVVHSSEVHEEYLAYTSANSFVGNGLNEMPDGMKQRGFPDLEKTK